MKSHEETSIIIDYKILKQRNKLYPKNLHYFCRFVAINWDMCVSTNDLREVDTRKLIVAILSIFFATSSWLECISATFNLLIER